MNRGHLSRALWVPVAGLGVGILLAAAVVYVVGRFQATGTAQPSPSDRAGSLESSPSAIETGAFSPPGTPSVGPTPELAAGWTISDFPDSEPYDRIERVVRLGDELFVVGGHSGQGGIWRSTDGVAWRIAADTPSAGTINGVFMHGIARTDAGFVAVGANYAIDGASPVAWFSLDGDTWTVVTPNPEECAVLDSLTAGGQQFVAVGSICKDDPQLGPGNDGVSFASTDGRQWQRSPASAVLLDIALHEVTWTGSEFMAAGLQSVDGLTWAPTKQGAPPIGTTRLVWANDRLVAVGSFADSQGQPQAAISSSTDGVTWTTQVLGKERSQARAIAIGSRGWVVVGNLIQSEGRIGTAVEWRSADGLRWADARRIMSQGLGYIDDLLATDSGVTGIGGVQRGAATDPWPPVIFRLAY
jgi:hypothetical protein